MMPRTINLDAPPTWVYLVEQGGRVVSSTFTLADAQDFVVEELTEHDDDPDFWRTADGWSTVQRFRWVNVGRLPEDHLGVGVPVVTHAA